MITVRLLNRFDFSKLTGVVILTIAMTIFNLTWSAPVGAASNPHPVARVTFSFDDGYASFLTDAAPALAAYGYSGTAYITTSYIGAENYLTWEQTAELQNIYGWEIGSHSATHPLMTEVDSVQLENEVLQSRLELEAHGFSPTSFATPFGDYNGAVEAAIAKYYDNHRPFHDTYGKNIWPYNDYLIQVRQVQAGVTVEQVKAYIDDAKAANSWLVLVFHDIKQSPSTDPNAYEYATADLSAIAAYTQSQDIEVKNMSASFVNSDDNLLSNDGFKDGLTGGWTTDSPENVTVDNGGNGNNPEPTHSIKMVASETSNIQLFSPQVDVLPDQRYVLKSYVNITSNNIQAGGEVALYVDEYNAAGNWISGQYLGAVSSIKLKNLNFAYNPTSLLVDKARIQFIVIAGSGIVVYVDSVELFIAQSDVVPPIVPTPDPQPEDPAPNEPGTSTVYLLENSGFENGMTGGWTTDSSDHVKADAAGNGNTEATSSIKITASPDKNVHLFSAITLVVSGENYTVKTFINIPTAFLNGEVAIYIDEYDANGAWISGQYLGAAHSQGRHDVTFAYLPSSSLAAKIRLQLIVTRGSGITAYIDDVQISVERASGNDDPTSPETDPVTPTQPEPEPDVSTQPKTNLLPNADFTDGLSGWATDSPTLIQPSADGKVTFSSYSTARNAHLFSSAVAVVADANYQASIDLNIQSGEVALYIDEYDTNGNWISGQYLQDWRAVGVQTVLTTYTPTSGNVVRASIQIIVIGSSSAIGTLDNVRLYLL